MSFIHLRVGVLVMWNEGTNNDITAHVLSELHDSPPFGDTSMKDRAKNAKMDEYCGIWADDRIKVGYTYV